MQNNIFNYAPKELVMDAFFAWLFEELNTDSLSNYKVEFLKNLKIEGFSDKSVISKIEKQKFNTDLLITIDDKKILFENKTTSTIHSNQLKVYKEKISNCDKYIYMKLAFIDYKERLEANKYGYTVVGAEDIKSALIPLKDCCQIVKQYYDYIEENYIHKFQQIKDSVENSDYKIYSELDAQRFFLSKLYEILEGKVEKLNFKYNSNNGGSPWTQLSIDQKPKIYGEKAESIFWRIDKKKKGYYIKLTQYAKISKEYKKDKTKRLKKLRKIINNILKNETNIKKSEVTDRGLYSSEIAIFYFSENKYENLFQTLKNISIEFCKEYDKL